MHAFKHHQVLISCTLLAMPYASAADEKTYEGWRIKQICKVQGQEEVVICKTGLKVYNPKNDLTLVFTTPFKEITYFDKHTGLMCKVPIGKSDSPYQRAVAFLSGLSLMDLPLHKVASLQVVGQNATKYSTTAAFAIEQINLSKTEAHSQRFRSASLTTFSNLSVADTLCRFLARHYGVPYNNEIQGVPASMRFASVTNSTTLFLETISCTKSKISEKEFLVPPGLKMTTSSQAVLAGDDAMLMMY